MIGRNIFYFDKRKQGGSPLKQRTNLFLPTYFNFTIKGQFPNFFFNFDLFKTIDTYCFLHLQIGEFKFMSRYRYYGERTVI